MTQVTPLSHDCPYRRQIAPLKAKGDLAEVIRRHDRLVGGYDATTDLCYYVPAAALGTGLCEMRLRLKPTRNHQRQLVRFAGEYVTI